MKKNILLIAVNLWLIHEFAAAQDTIRTPIPIDSLPRFSEPFQNIPDLIIGFDKLSADTTISKYNNKKHIRPEDCYRNIFVYNAIYQKEYEEWKAKNFPEKKIIKIEMNLLDDIKSGKLTLQTRFANPMDMDQFGKMKSPAIKAPLRYEREKN